MNVGRTYIKQEMIYTVFVRFSMLNTARTLVTVSVLWS